MVGASLETSKGATSSVSPSGSNKINNKVKDEGGGVFGGTKITRTTSSTLAQNPLIDEHTFDHHHHRDDDDDDEDNVSSNIRHSTSSSNILASSLDDLAINISHGNSRSRSSRGTASSRFLKSSSCAEPFNCNGLTDHLVDFTNTTDMKTNNLTRK